MPSSLLQIIDRGDGEIVLQSADDDSDPLVTIRFSDEARVFLTNGEIEVARAMIQAGIQAVAVISERGDTELDSSQDTQRVLH